MLFLYVVNVNNINELSFIYFTNLLVNDLWFSAMIMKDIINKSKRVRWRQKKVKEEVIKVQITTYKQKSFLFRKKVIATFRVLYFVWKLMWTELMY